MASIEEIPFHQLLEALQDAETPISPKFLYRLSDLQDYEISQLSKTWDKLPVRRRQALMEDLEHMGDSDYLLSYEAIGRLGLKDEDAKVRMLAIQVLYQTEEPALIQDLLALLSEDSSDEVRAAAAFGLGQYVYLGEIDEIPTTSLEAITDRLLKSYAEDPSILVQRRSLEALGFSGRDEVTRLIKKAFSSGERDWMVSALFAMGRSADDRWTESVLTSLDHQLPHLRAEASKAAGELELREAGPRLIELTDDSDEAVRSAAIWSLSQIGGYGARETLEALMEKADDDDEVDLLESALDNLAFTEETTPFSIFDLPDKPDDRVELEEEILDYLDEELEDYEEEDEERPNFLDIEDAMDEDEDTVD